MIANLHSIKDYFEPALFGKTSEPVSSFLTESLDRAFSRHSFHAIGSSNLYSSLVSVGIVNTGQVELGIDCSLNPNASVCSALHSDIYKKLGTNANYVAIKPVQAFTPLFRLNVGNKVAHQSLAAKNGYGSLGGFIFPLGQEQSMMIISNNHVLANSNNANLGDAIYLMEDGASKLGSLKNFKHISPTGINHLDLAVGQLDGSWDHTNMTNVGYREPLLGEEVYKTGARTQYTTGIVRSTHTSIRVNYGNFSAVFRNQIEIISNGFYSPFSQPGDSGSSIKASSDGRWIGLLFSGNGTSTIANRQTEVVNQLISWGLKIK